MDKTSQSNCLFVPLLLKKDWLYFSETLLWPIRPFLNDHKHQSFFSWMSFSPASVGGGYFEANFAHFCLSVFYVFFYLLRIIQYFLTKFFTVVFGISLRITTLKIFFTSCPPSAGHHFGIFLGLFWQIVLDICQVFSHGILGRCCWCSSEGHCTIFLIWRNISLILSNCSIFSHETLFTCSWYNPDHH